MQIEKDEVGRVLNFSEGGLSFSSFNPVPQSGPLYFWFSFNLKDRIEAMGEIVWTDSSRKIGGIRFTHLPQNSRRQIQAWLSPLPAQPVSHQEAGPQIAVAGEPDKTRRAESDLVARFVSKARAKYFPAAAGAKESAVVSAPPRTLPRPSNPPVQEGSKAVARPQPSPPPVEMGVREERSTPSSPLQAGSKPLFQQTYTLNLNHPDDVSKPAPVPVVDAGGGLIPAEKYYAEKRRQLVLGVVLGVCISAGVALAALKYSHSLRRSENAPTAVAGSSLAKNDSLATPPAPQSIPVPSAPASDIFSGNGSIRKSASKPTSNKSAGKAPAQIHSQILEAKATNPPVRTLGQQPPSSTPSTGKKPETLQQLWAAVQAGNSNAAVKLAEHYIQGDGVPQNCQQARVLLLMASEKRNPAAIKRLDELDKDKSTCP